MSGFSARAALTPTAPVISGAVFGMSTAQINLITPSLEPQTGIAQYALYRRLTGSNAFALVASILPTGFPFVDAGLSTATSYDYVLRGIDASPQQDLSPNSNIVTIATSSQGLVKFHGGHYAWFDTTDGTTGVSRMATAHATLQNNPAVVGYKIYAKWSQLEGATAGDYSPLDSLIASVRSVLGTSGKKWMLGLFDRTFGSTGAGGTFSGAAYPTYVISSGFAVISNASTSVGGVANMVNFGSAGCIARMVALAQAIASRLDTDPNFECYDPMGETSITPSGPWHTGSSAGPSANFSNATFRDAVISLMQGASAAFPHTLVRLQGNFVPSNDNTIFQAWYNTLLPLGNVAFGGPDPPLTLATGYSADARYWMGTLAPGVTDFRGVRPRIGEVQEDGLGFPRVAGATPPPPTPAQSVATIAQGQIINLHVAHMIWNDETDLAVVFSDILAYINANPTTNGPPSFGNWNTGGGVGVSSAPLNPQAFATTLGAYVLFDPPTSPGGAPLTSYTVNFSTGGSFTAGPTRIQDEFNSQNYQQLQCRMDIDHLPAGIAVSFTVQANSASGAGTPSVPTNVVTPLAKGNLYINGGGTTPLTLWNDRSFSCVINYGVTPGTASRNTSGGNATHTTAPANVDNAAWGVVEVDCDAGQNGGYQPSFNHENPANTQNGRLRLVPYSQLTIDVYPTQNQALGQQGIFIGWAKCLWVNGTTTASGSTLVTDATQSPAFGNPGWPANIFVNCLVTNLRTGATANVTANTATTITVNSALGLLRGDKYEISVSDVGTGTFVNNIGQGSPITGVSGPLTMVSGVRNRYVINLTAFNGGATAYPSITTDQILKPGFVLNSAAPEAHYFGDVFFS